MKLQELATLHIRENILSEATTIKYHSVVSIFIKDTGVHLANHVQYYYKMQVNLGFLVHLINIFY
jgi:hypothetical protein